MEIYGFLYNVSICHGVSKLLMILAAICQLHIMFLFFPKYKLCYLSMNIQFHVWVLLFYVVIFWQLLHDKIHIYEEFQLYFLKLCRFCSLYFSHTKKRLNMKNIRFMSNQFTRYHVIWLRKHCEIYEKSSVMQRSKCCVVKD